MKIMTRNNMLIFSGIVIGGTGGFLYYSLVGCRTGSCAITSNPWLSVLWGAAVGYLVFDLFRKKKSTEVKSDQPGE